MLLNEWSAIVVAPLLPYEPNKFWRKKVWEEKSSTFSAIRTFFCSNFLPRPISESIRNFCSNLGTLVYILDPIISKKNLFPNMLAFSFQLDMTVFIVPSNRLIWLTLLCSFIFILCGQLQLLLLHASMISLQFNIWCSIMLANLLLLYLGSLFYLLLLNPC